MAVDRGNESRARPRATQDLFMALRRIAQTIFFATRLFSDIHMHARGRAFARRFATETKARILQ